MRRVLATRYVTPLREGGSLPAIVEGDDDGTYVVKFRGAGQGKKALIAELLSGEIARALGLPVPEIVFIEIDPALGRTEPDDEIRSLLARSIGNNLALDFLPGSLSFDPRAKLPIEGRLASQIVWFDAAVMNVDRTARNTNLLEWHRRLWLIDHGASLIVHHDWTNFRERARAPWKQSAHHVLLPFADQIAEVSPALIARLSTDCLDEIIALIPDDWLLGDTILPEPAAQRDAYRELLRERLAVSNLFVEEALRARALLV